MQENSAACRKWNTFSCHFTEVFPEMQVSESEYDWILLNVNLSGYYRVKYDQLNLKRLVHLLENDPKVRSCICFFFFFFKLINRLLSVYFFLHSLPIITLMKTWNNKNLCLSCRNKWPTIAQLKSMAVFHSRIGTGPNSFTQALSWKTTYKRWHSVFKFILISLLNFTQRTVSMGERPRFICY